MIKDDLISRSAMITRVKNAPTWVDIGDGLIVATDYPEGMYDPKDVMNAIEKLPAVDAVSRTVVEQIRWERDTAIEQLKDYGIPFGGTAPDVVEVVRCKDCEYGDWDNKDADAMVCLRTHDGYWRSGNDFCSHGKRRVDNGE